jgi:hypothetical protein
MVVILSLSVSGEDFRAGSFEPICVDVNNSSRGVTFMACVSGASPEASTLNEILVLPASSSSIFVESVLA